MKDYRSVDAISMEGLIAAINVMAKDDGSKCVGWQQTKDGNTGGLHYEAIMEREIPDPLTEPTQATTGEVLEHLHSIPPPAERPLPLKDREALEAREIIRRNQTFSM